MEPAQHSDAGAAEAPAMRMLRSSRMDQTDSGIIFSADGSMALCLAISFGKTR